ncbi:hypothetical protein [Alkalibacterium kapii]|uniref:Asparagine synthetase domain-containing protein n=1 Tax=Alkalibacterium kapii TaxID=426704 RepID=A0A511ATK9_9LACT|nr:hypothetical protein [Alkalibacterium kapii]GEK91052.1 hypothetical protein AKA01nite_06740 [Alkalibacterium kapii]
MKFNYLMKRTIDQSYEHFIELDPFVFNYDTDSLAAQATDGEKTVIAYGKIIDSRNPDLTEQAIVEKLAQAKDSVQLVEWTEYMAGRYVLIYQNTKELILFPDATCSVPIFYSVIENKWLISSKQKTIADALELPMSDASVEIKSQAEEQQPLPYDRSMYEGIRVVIPNHFLNVKDQRAKRFFPIRELESRSVDEVIKETITLTQNVVDSYMMEDDLVIPLTAGKDSRLILSFFKKYQDRIQLYTFDHQPKEAEPDDIKIPRQLTSRLGLSYQVLPRVQMDDETFKSFVNYFSGTQNRRILENALTLKQSGLKSSRFVTGDIIPIVKSNFGKKLPESLATTNYLVTKTHNYSDENKRIVRQWRKNVKKHAHENGVSLFDLFFWESRLGRWLPNNMSNYDTMSDPVLIFNNRRLIESWISIPREQRVDTDFHEQIISRLWPELLDIPLTSGTGLVNDLTRNSYVYYGATFFKYYLKKIQKVIQH